MLFFFNTTATTEIYTLSLHDALPISGRCGVTPPPDTSTEPHCGPTCSGPHPPAGSRGTAWSRSEEHTSELQSLRHLVCRLLLEKKNVERLIVTKYVPSEEESHTPFMK